MLLPMSLMLGQTGLVILANTIKYGVFVFPVLIKLTCVFMIVGIKKSRGYQDQRVRDLNERLSRFNNQEFRAKGFSWSLGVAGAWIQLNLDFVIAGAQQNLTGGNPMGMGGFNGPAPANGQYAFTGGYTQAPSIDAGYNPPSGY